MIIETRVTGWIEENCYLVFSADQAEAVIIDPGDNAPQLAACLRERNATVAAYLLTHGHADHLSALAALTVLFPAPVYLHPADAQWCFQSHNELPGLYPAPAKPAVSIQPACEGAPLALAGGLWTIMETPGHTPGSVCFRLENPAAIFTGDTLFAGSVGRTDLPGGNPRQMTASLRKLAALPDPLPVYPGHGPPTTIGREKQFNRFLAL